MDRSHLIQLVSETFSESNALDIATQMTRFYRSPGASGYHRASAMVADRLRDAGMDEVWVEPFPLDGESRLLNQAMPMAWEPYSAELRLGSSSGKLLVSYEDAPSCLPWWTPSTPEGGVTLDLVDVGTGERPEDYEGRDVEGKVVLIRGTTRPTGFHHSANQAMQRGAAGIITDYLLYQTDPIRTRESVPNAVQLLRMPNQRSNPAWAIVVDLPAAELLSRQAAAGSTQVWADIQCRTFQGEAHNLLADIKGTDENSQILQFVSHATAGTKPGANCASGPALMIELGRSIMSLINRGLIPRPKRTIRFLVNVEGHGSKHYIANHREELARTIGVLAVDSVGHDQRKCKSALAYYHSPSSLPTFLNDYFAGLIEAAPKDTRWVFHTEPSVPLVTFMDLPYMPWSDNKYYPSFGVPSPLFMSWPDLYFHTQLLTADNLDPAVFRSCGIVAMLGALELADAGPDDVLGIMRQVANRSHFRLGAVANQAMDPAETARVRRRLKILANTDQAAVKSAVSLITNGQQSSNLAAAAEEIQREIGARLEQTLGWLGDGADEEDYPPGNAVPARLVERDPPGLAGTPYWDLFRMSEEMHARDPKMLYDSLRIIADEVWNFTNGSRTVNEIAWEIGAEFDFDLEPRHILNLLQGLEREGYVRLDV